MKQRSSRRLLDADPVAMGTHRGRGEQSGGCEISEREYRTVPGSVEPAEKGSEALLPSRERERPVLRILTKSLRQARPIVMIEEDSQTMSAPAMGIAGHERALRFWNTTIGKKAVMAVSGLVLAGFVVAHLLGNLQIFMGADQFNGYARTLRRLPELLWTVRILLTVMVLLHIWSSVQLAVLKSEARPIRYVKYESSDSTYASRTMYWSGPIIAAFVVYHLMQFTFGNGGTPHDPFDAYGNVIAGFKVIPVSIFYIVAIALLCIHLRHGLWSLLQTLGFHHPRYTPRLKKAAGLVSFLIFVGFVSIPIAVLLRMIPRIF